jgi:uncharacterized protein YndB with AHSA1/START domain
MNDKLTAKSEITIHAPAAKVWDALTNPKLIKQYFFGTETKSTWKVGSPILFKGQWEGKPYTDKGEILQNKRNKVLQYTHWSSLSGVPDVPESYHTVTFRVHPGKDKTLLSVSESDLTGEKARVESRTNWSMVLRSIKQLLEKS